MGPQEAARGPKEEAPRVRIPVGSTIGEILERNGVVLRKRRAHGGVSVPYPALSTPSRPNDVWCIDYKGQFRLGNGSYCYPLTLTDAASRYILACEAFDRISGDDVRCVLERIFGSVGLPTAIRYDGGAPFASKGLARLSKLSTWWLSLGIQLEQIEPASPQQNGRHERMHRTLKAETTRPPARTLLAQQERFDAFIDTFNHERPHEALEMKCPADVYVTSTRTSTPLRNDYPLHDLALRVSRNGHIRFPNGRRGDPQYFLGEALASHSVGLRELDDGRWLVSFHSLALGYVDRAEKRFVHAGDSERAGLTSPMCPV